MTNCFTFHTTMGAASHTHRQQLAFFALGIFKEIARWIFGNQFCALQTIFSKVDIPDCLWNLTNIVPALIQISFFINDPPVIEIRNAVIATRSRICCLKRNIVFLHKIQVVFWIEFICKTFISLIRSIVWNNQPEIGVDVFQHVFLLQMRYYLVG